MVNCSATTSAPPDSAREDSDNIVTEAVLSHIRALQNGHPGGSDFLAQCGDNSVTVFIDTGAEVNLVKADFMQSLPGTSYETVPSNVANVKGIGGSSLNICGRVRLKLRVGQVRLPMDALVVAGVSFPGDLLLGRPTMSNYGMRLLLDEDVLVVQNNVIPLRYHSGSQPPTVCVVQTSSPGDDTLNDQFATSPTVVGSVSADETLDASGTNPCYFKQLCSAKLEQAVTLQPNQLTRVSLRLDKEWFKAHGFDRMSGVSCIVEPESIRLKGIITDPVLQEIEDDHITVFLANMRPSSIRLHKDTKVLSCTVLKANVMEQSLHHFQVSFLSADQAVCAVTAEDEDAGEADTDAPAALSLPPITEDMVKGVQLTKQMKPLTNLLNRFRDTVALPGEPLGRTPLIQHSIRLKPDANPIYIPAYRLPHAQREHADKLVREMLEQGVIRESNSPWNSPLLLVPKKDGTWRPVIDYRRLNLVTVKDRFPLPVISDLLHSLGKNKVFSTLDLLSGFWQIDLDEKSRPLTAFSTPNGHWEFISMPFGLHSSPITFSRLMTRIFRHMLNREVLVYLDDIVVMAPDVTTHLQRLEKVLLKLQEANLKLKLSKCRFLQTRIEYLGHVVDSEGVHPNPDKVKAIAEWPVPVNVDRLRSFLGLAGYYRSFVRSFSQIASPLTALLKKDAVFQWGGKQQWAFDYLKRCLIEAPILTFPDFTKTFIVHTDACIDGLGAALMQQSSSGKLCPIAYASRSCTPAERNYSITELETLAVVWALKHFKEYIYSYPIIVYTDHRAVLGVFRDKNLSGKFARWFLTIRDFDPLFQYVPGKTNVVADALSRNVAAVYQDQVITFNEVTVRQEQRRDPVWGPVISWLEGSKKGLTVKSPVPLANLSMHNGLLFRNVSLGSPARRVWQLVVPTSLVSELLALVHDSPQAGHPASDRCYTQVRMMYFWPRMQSMIKDYVTRCQVCNVHRGNTAAPQEVLRYPTPSYPWERVSMDILGGFPCSMNGYKYLLVIVDAFTRYCELVPVRDKSAVSVAAAFKERILDRHNAPTVLVTDNGLEFNNAVLSELCRLYNVRKCNILPHHPASNGLSERLNRKILNTLRANVNFRHEAWDEFISDVQCTLNRSYHKTIRDTPFYALHGFDKVMPYDVLHRSPDHSASTNEYVAAKFAHTQQIHQRLSANIASETDAFTSQANKKAKDRLFTVGMLVMEVSFVKASDAPKFDAKFEGPYRIIDHLGGNKYQIKHLDSGKLKCVHGDNLRPLGFDWDEDVGSSQGNTPRPAEAPVHPPVSQPDPPSSSPPPSVVPPRYNLRTRPSVQYSHFY